MLNVNPMSPKEKNQDLPAKEELFQALEQIRPEDISNEDIPPLTKEEIEDYSLQAEKKPKNS